MHQARIPISGGGGYRGNIDLTQRLEDNPIIQALLLISQIKRQGEEQPQGMEGQIVTEGGKTWLVDRRTGQKIDLGIKATPKVEELLKLMDLARKYKEPTVTETGLGESAEEDLLGLRGLEKYDIPGQKRKRLGLDWLAKDIPPRKGIRRKGEVSTIGKAIEAPKDFTAFGGMGAERYYGPGGPGFMPRKKVKSKIVGPEPTTVKEFEAEVARLKQIDMKKAKAYYDKWVGKWQ